MTLIKTDDRYVLLEKDPKNKYVARIIIDRPEKMNALTIDMWYRMNELTRQAEADDDVKVIIYKGMGKHFSTGQDVAEIGHYYGMGDGTKGRKVVPNRVKLRQDDECWWGRRGIMQTVLYCDKATICQASGYCYGGGEELSNCCDITIAGESALFTHPGFRYIGPLGNMALWYHIIGVKKTKEMMLTGRPINAQEALQCGMVNKVVPDADLEAEVDLMAEIVSRQPRDAIVQGKANLELGLNVVGVSTGFTAGYITHGFQVGLHYEDDEFNLLKARRDKGIKGAIQEREEHYSSSPTALMSPSKKGS